MAIVLRHFPLVSTLHSHDTLPALRLRDMYRPTDHCTTPAHEQANNRMHPSPPALFRSPYPSHHPISAPNKIPLTQAPRHGAYDAQTRGYGCSFKVFRFSRRILGQGRNCDIEASETRETAEDEEGKEEGIEWGAEAEGEGGDSRSNTEGYLFRPAENIRQYLNCSQVTQGIHV